MPLSLGLPGVFYDWTQVINFWQECHRDDVLSFSASYEGVMMLICLITGAHSFLFFSFLFVNTFFNPPKNQHIKKGVIVPGVSVCIFITLAPHVQQSCSCCYYLLPRFIFLILFVAPSICIYCSDMQIVLSGWTLLVKTAGPLHVNGDDRLCVWGLLSDVIS